MIEIIVSLIFIVLVCGFFFTTSNKKSMCQSRLYVLCICVLSIILAIFSAVAGEILAAVLLALAATLWLINSLSRK